MKRSSKMVIIIAVICMISCIEQQAVTKEETMRWDNENTQSYLTISDDGLTVSWDKDFEAAWLSSQTTARLKDDIFKWDFNVQAIADRQIGVGIMTEPPNWGFYGYLGAGKGAWSYDAYQGAIVTETRAVHSNLPNFSKNGVVSVILDLKENYTCTFVVNGQETPSINLPEGCTIIPAACLLKKGQKVRIENFEKVR